MILKKNHSHCDFFICFKRDCDDIFALKVFVNHFSTGCKTIQSMNQIKQSTAVADPDVFPMVKYIQSFFRKISGIKFSLSKRKKNIRSKIPELNLFFRGQGMIFAHKNIGGN